MSKNPLEPEMMTPQDVAEFLGITKQRVSQLIQSGKLKASRNVDGTYSIRREDAEKARHRKTGRPSKDESRSEAETEERPDESQREVWKITIEAVVKIERKGKSNEIEDEDKSEQSDDEQRE
jgi:excisionase family DNA binding protein